MTYRSYRRFAEAPILFLIALNVVLYIATLADPDLLYTLGLQPSTWMERPWTLITNLFVHGGLWHIAANMLTLYFFGRYLCMLVGDARFLTLYFLGGIAGNFLYILLSSSNAVVIGASGAIFAIAGALTLMAPKIEGFLYSPTTGPPPPLGSGHRRLRRTLLFPQRGLAGSPRRPRRGPGSGLFLQKSQA